MNELISVIVPVYNGELYLEECVESILAQTYRNFELIIVNDGSTDGTSEIIKKYAGKDSRIKFLNKENSGVSAARNSGISMSTGGGVYCLHRLRRFNRDGVFREVIGEGSMRI